MKSVLLPPGKAATGKKQKAPSIKSKVPLKDGKRAANLCQGLPMRSALRWYLHLDDLRQRWRYCGTCGHHEADHSPAGCRRCRSEDCGCTKFLPGTKKRRR